MADVVEVLIFPPNEVADATSSKHIIAELRANINRIERDLGLLRQPKQESWKQAFERFIHSFRVPDHGNHDAYWKVVMSKVILRFSEDMLQIYPDKSETKSKSPEVKVLAGCLRKVDEYYSTVLQKHALLHTQRVELENQLKADNTSLKEEIETLRAENERVKAQVDAVFKLLKPQ